MKHLLFVFLTATFFYTGTLAAQSRTSYMPASIRQDTVFKYDTVFVTDTVRVRYKQPEMEQLPAGLLLSGQEGNAQKYLIISATGAATFSPIRIIDSVNNSPFKQTDSMKKIGFFGVVLFAFQHMVLAQNNISINVGGGGYRNKVNSTMSSKTAPEFLLGVGYQKDFANGKLSFNADADYHFLAESNFDAVPRYNGFDIFTNDQQYSNYHALSLPVALSWNTRWFSPGIGVEYYLKKTPLIKKEYLNNGLEPYTSEYIVVNHGVSLLASIQAPVSSRTKMRLVYAVGLLPESAGNYGGTAFQSYQHRLEMKLSYRLR